MSLAAVVQHLQVLEESGLVQTEKVGRVRTCRIEPAGLNVALQWIDDRRSVWERRVERLGGLLGVAGERGLKTRQKKNPGFVYFPAAAPTKALGGQRTAW